MVRRRHLLLVKRRGSEYYRKVYGGIPRVELKRFRERLRREKPYRIQTRILTRGRVREIFRERHPRTRIPSRLR